MCVIHAGHVIYCFCIHYEGTDYMCVGFEGRNPGKINDDTSMDQYNTQTHWNRYVICLPRAVYKAIMLAVNPIIIVQHR